MKQRGWCVLLSVAFVLLVFCAARDLRKPAASDGAQRIEVGAAGAQANEALESAGAVQVEAANELQLRQLETAREAQRIEQQEAALELQRRQRESTRPPSENPGVSVEAIGIAAGG